MPWIDCPHCGDKTWFSEQFPNCDKCHKPHSDPKILTDPLQEGFSFGLGRWTGDKARVNATIMRSRLTHGGRVTGLYEGSTTQWEKGKGVQVPYFKVFIYHPTEKGYYTWFEARSLEEWPRPNTKYDLSLSTYYEFAQDTK